MQIAITIIARVMSLFFVIHYVVMLRTLYQIRNSLEYSHKRFYLLLQEYKTFSSCVQAYNYAQTDEERDKIRDIMEVNASTSILRDDDLV